MSERFDVIVVGSGAGGGLIAGELAQAGVSVLLLETGPHRTAADFTRWEAHASHELWYPPSLVEPADGAGPPLSVIRGRCVGGTSTINTKVAMRPFDEDYERWHAAGGLVGEGGDPVSAADMAPYFERVEARLGVRERSDWQQCIRTVVPGFEAMGARLEPVRSYTDHNCMRCGSCLQGCPTNAGKNSMNVYIHPPWAEGRLDLRAECTAKRVVIEDRGSGPEATGVEYEDASGRSHSVRAETVVVACGVMATPQLLLRSGIREAAGGSPSSQLVGRHVGWHPNRIVCGLFDDLQDAHRVYPISAHCTQFQADGYVLEASTVQDPIGFAVMLCDEEGVPMWGSELNEMTRRYRYFSGLLAMVTDENHGTAWVDEDDRDRYSYEWNDRERQRDEVSLKFARDVLFAAGAKRVLHTGQSSTHIQGGCRMGSDPERSVVDAHGESHDLRRLFVGDGSVVPSTIAANPSLTIFALAQRLAEYLAGGEHGYFGRATAQAAA